MDTSDIPQEIVTRLSNREILSLLASVIDDNERRQLTSILRAELERREAQSNYKPSEVKA